MTIEIGTRLGPYEILAPIGAGGMGEVYKANDTRLDRTVAIKVLPEHLAESPERKARFEREAKAISQLNHPHICTLYDVGEQDGVHLRQGYGGQVDFIVMEHIEGETLAERLKNGALKLDQALEYGIQIADGLDKAHRAGIVHRDLKPGNVMLTKSGVKLLDFGLARLVEDDPDADTSDAPTRHKDLTAEETIIGTLQYMAPEQLERQPADARTDIFAFGVVLYEMVTGKKAFEGKSQASLISSIMTSDPPAMSTLESMTPPALDHVVRRCLAKEPDGRWQSAADLAGELSWVAEGGSDVSIAGRPVDIRAPSRRLAVAVAALSSVLVAGAAVWYLSREPAPPIARFVVGTPATESFVANFVTRDIAVSPDGRHIVYRTASAGEFHLYLRSVDQLAGTSLYSTRQGFGNPFFSPDGRWVGFSTSVDNAWKKVSVLGGPPATLFADATTPPQGASWGPDDTIIFTNSGSSGLLRGPAIGGKPEMLTTPDVEQGETAHRWPEILPGGEAVLFNIVKEDGMHIAVLDLVTGERRVLLANGSNPHYAPSGHIVYGVDGALLAVPFDLGRRELTGDPVPLLEGVMTDTNGAVEFALSDDGSLVYVAGGSQGGARSLVWVDRDRRETDVGAGLRAYTYLRLSLDGSQVALDVRDEDKDIWIWDFSRDTLRRLTFDPGDDFYPTWTPDGERVAFSSSRGGARNLYWKPADGTGTAERLSESENNQAPQAFSADGKQLVYWEIDPETRSDLSMRSMDGDGSSKPLLATEFRELNAEVSPDGRWLAFQSDASGQFEIYVRPFPDVDEAQWQISRDGGTEPLWSPAGGELFYRGSGGLMSVSIRTDPRFEFENPEMLFDESYRSGSGRTYDVSRDGKRFLMIKEAGLDEGSRGELIIVQNWFEELKRLVPRDK